MTVYVTKPCIVCGKRSQVDMERGSYEAWKGGALAQDVWPDATPEWREVVITGTHPVCWDVLIGEEEDE